MQKLSIADITLKQAAKSGNCSLSFREKIEIAKLEKLYIEKFLKVISPCKLNKIKHAEKSFQRDLMKKMLPSPPAGERKDTRKEYPSHSIDK